MSFMLVHGPCYCCGRIISYSATYVPSVRINGEREALCRGCVQELNELCESEGLEPHPIHPEAYKPERTAF